MTHTEPTTSPSGALVEWQRLRDEAELMVAVSRYGRGFGQITDSQAMQVARDVAIVLETFGIPEPPLDVGAAPSSEYRPHD